MLDRNYDLPLLKKITVLKIPDVIPDSEFQISLKMNLVTNASTEGDTLLLNSPGLEKRINIKCYSMN